MRFEQLEYLIAVADSGSFSAAAQKLYVTQQAISISMKPRRRTWETSFYQRKQQNLIE